jgi:SAM-dependent methyltransferase
MNKELFHVRRDCRLCHSPALDLAAPLGAMPIATPNFQVTGADRNAPVFRTGVPLELYHCRDCGLLQILHVGNPEIQYRDYVYTTSISLGLREHFQNLAADTIRKRKLTTNSLVVELGSNDGTLLRCFKNGGMRVLGVDPAVEIAGRATKNGIETLPEFFGENLGRSIAAKYGKADVIIANNMLANIDDLDAFFRGVAALLAPNGVFIFETQYGVDVTEKNLLDTVYHEHLTYFKVRPLIAFCKRMGMKLIEVEGIWTKGGSIRVTVQSDKGSDSVDPSVAKFLESEQRLGVDEPIYYRKFLGKIEAIKAELHAIIDKCHAEGGEVAGYGVSVGTLALLAQFDLAKKIDFLTDDDTTKGNMLSGPGYDIPIVSPDEFAARAAPVTIVFAWRYTGPIAKKHPGYFAKGGKFVVPLPAVSVRG